MVSSPRYNKPHTPILTPAHPPFQEGSARKANPLYMCTMVAERFQLPRRS